MGEIDVVRISGAPAPSSMYRRYGFRRSAARGAVVSAIDAAWANISNIFAGGTGSSRYSTGIWPVLYSAMQRETAQAEKGYWLLTSVFSKRTRPDEVKCIEYVMRIAGRAQDLLAEGTGYLNLVHPTNYTYCQSLGEKAVLEEFDFMVVPSARRRGGVNVPILRKAAVIEVFSALETKFVAPGGALIYQGDGVAFDVTIDDVYGAMGGI